MICAGPADAQINERSSSADFRQRVEAQENATNVIYHLSLDRAYKDAFLRMSLLREEENAIFQLVRLLTGGGVCVLSAPGAAMAFTFPPAQKAPPAPVRRRQRTRSTCDGRSQGHGRDTRPPR